MVTDVYAKSNYDRLRIDKALEFRKPDNNKNKNKKPKNNVLSDRGPLPGPINMMSMVATGWNVYSGGNKAVKERSQVK